MNYTTSTKLQNTTIIFLIIAPAACLWYALFVFNPQNADNFILYLIQILADSIAIIVILTLWITILLDVVLPTHHRAQTPQPDPEFIKKAHAIDVLITVAGEPAEVVERTVQAAMAMDYPHLTHILDDGKSPQIKAIAKKWGAKYHIRDNRQFAKAGNVNHGLAETKGDFFIILDADQVTEPHFITTLLPYLANPQVAMVQSPQDFENTDEFIAKGTAQAQEIFYKHVCPAKNASNSVFCVGTNMIFRRQAITEIGGIAQIGHSEDIWTALRLHEKGWKTVFVNQILAHGNAPSSINSYFKQQLRWAKGGVGMLFENNPLKNSKLTLDQRLQYFSSNMFFLVWLPMLTYLVMPLLYLLFEIKPLLTDDGFTWLLHYISYVALYFSLSYLLIHKLHIATTATATASFFPYLLAFWEIVVGKTQYVWVTTTSKASRIDIVMKWLWPHLLIIITTILATFIAWYEPRNLWTTFYNTIWAYWNVYLLVIFIKGNNAKIAQ